MSQSIKKLIKKHIEDKRYYTEVDDTKILCNACNSIVNIRKKSVKFSIDSHENGKRHKDLLSVWSKYKYIQPLTKDLIEITQDNFTDKFTECLIAMNVPFRKVNNPLLKKLFRDYFKRECPDESTLRKNHLKSVYLRYLERIRLILDGKWIYLQIDESRIEGRSIVSVLVGALDGNPPVSYCINVLELKMSANNVNTLQALNDSLTILWPDKIFYERVRLIVTDQASYLLKAIRNFKALFSQARHITCLCHALHRVCEEVRFTFKNAAQLVTNFKIVYNKSSRRVFGLEMTIQNKLEKFPVETRWGTWIQFVAFLYNNLDGIHEYTRTLIDEDNSSIHQLIEDLGRHETREELKQIADLSDICVTISNLEQKGLRLEEQIDILNRAKDKLPEVFQLKLNRSLSNNPDFYEITNHSTLEEQNNFKYAPLVSVDVERSFSQFKCILTERRTNFTEENLKMYCVAHFNSSLF